MDDVGFSEFVRAATGTDVAEGHQHTFSVSVRLDVKTLHHALFLTGHQIPLVDVEYAVAEYCRLIGEGAR